MERSGMVTPAAADPCSSQVPAAYFPPYPPFFPPFDNPYRPDFHEHFRQHLLHPFPHPHQLYAAAAATEQQQHAHPFAFWPPCPRSPDVAAACGGADPFRSSVGIDLQQQQQQRAGEEAYYSRGDNNGVTGPVTAAGTRVQKQQLVEDGTSVHAASSPYYPFYAYNCAPADPTAAGAGDASGSNSTTETSSTHAASTPGAFSFASLPTAAAGVTASDTDASGASTSAFCSAVEDAASITQGGGQGESAVAGSSFSSSTTGTGETLQPTALSTVAATDLGDACASLPQSSSAATDLAGAESLSADTTAADTNGRTITDDAAGAHMASAEDTCGLFAGASHTLQEDRQDEVDVGVTEGDAKKQSVCEEEGPVPSVSCAAGAAALRDAPEDIRRSASVHSRASTSSVNIQRGEAVQAPLSQTAAPQGALPEAALEAPGREPTADDASVVAAAIGPPSEYDSENAVPPVIATPGGPTEETSSTVAAADTGDVSLSVDETAAATTALPVADTSGAVGKLLKATGQYETSSHSPLEQQHQEQEQHSERRVPLQQQQHRRFAVRVPQLRWTAESPTDMSYLRCFSRVYGKRGEPVVWCKRKGRPWWPGLLVSPLDPFLNPPLPATMKRKFQLLQQQQQQQQHHPRMRRGRNKERRLLLLCCGTWRYWWVAAAGLRDFRAAYEEIAPRVRRLGGLANVAVQQALEECSWRDHPDYNSSQSSLSLLTSRRGGGVPVDAENDASAEVGEGGDTQGGRQGVLKREGEVDDAADGMHTEEEGCWMTENECSTDSEGDPECVDSPLSSIAFSGVRAAIGGPDIAAGLALGSKELPAEKEDSGGSTCRRQKTRARPCGVCDAPAASAGEEANTSMSVANVSQHRGRTLGIYSRAISATGGTCAVQNVTTTGVVHVEEEHEQQHKAPKHSQRTQQRQQSIDVQADVSGGEAISKKGIAEPMCTNGRSSFGERVSIQDLEKQPKADEAAASIPRVIKTGKEQDKSGDNSSAAPAAAPINKSFPIGDGIATHADTAQREGLQKMQIEEEERQRQQEYLVREQTTVKKRKPPWGSAGGVPEEAAAARQEEMLQQQRIRQRKAAVTEPLHADVEKERNTSLAARAAVASAATPATREKLNLPPGACEQLGPSAGFIASVSSAAASTDTTATADAIGAAAAGASSPGRVSVRLSASRLAPTVLSSTSVAAADINVKRLQQQQQHQPPQQKDSAQGAAAGPLTRGKDASVGGGRGGGAAGVQLLHAPFAPEDDAEDIQRLPTDPVAEVSAEVGPTLPLAGGAMVVKAAAEGVEGLKPPLDRHASHREPPPLEQQPIQLQQRQLTTTSSSGEESTEPTSSGKKVLPVSPGGATAALFPNASGVTDLQHPASVVAGEDISSSAVARQKEHLREVDGLATAGAASGGAPASSSNGALSREGGTPATVAGEPSWRDGLSTRPRKQTAEVKQEDRALARETDSRDMAAAAVSAGTPAAGLAASAPVPTVTAEGQGGGGTASTAAFGRRGSDAQGVNANFAAPDGQIVLGGRSSIVQAVVPEKAETTAAASASSLPPAVAALLNSGKEQQPQMSKAAAAAAAVAAAAERNAQATTAFANFLQQQQQQQKQLQAEVEAAAAAAAAAVMRGLPAAGAMTAGRTAAGGAAGKAAAAADTSSRVSGADQTSREQISQEGGGAVAPAGAATVVPTPVAQKTAVATGQVGNVAVDNGGATADSQNNKDTQQRAGGENAGRSVSGRKGSSTSSSRASRIGARGGSRSRSSRSRGSSSGSRNPRVRRSSRSGPIHRRSSSRSSGGFRRGWRAPQQRGGRRGYGRRDSSSRSRNSSRSTSRSSGGDGAGPSLRRRGPPAPAARRGYARDFRGVDEQKYSPGVGYHGRRGGGGGDGSYRRPVGGGSPPSWRGNRRYSSSERSTSGGARGRYGRRAGMGCSSSSGEECMSSSGRRFFPAPQQGGRGLGGGRQPQPPHHMQHGKSAGGLGGGNTGAGERQRMRQLSSRSRSSSRRCGEAYGSRMSSPAAKGGPGAPACRGGGGRSSRSCSRRSSSSPRNRRGESYWRWGGGGGGYRGAPRGRGARRLSPVAGAPDMSNIRSSRQHRVVGGGSSGSGSGGSTTTAPGRGRGTRWGQQHRQQMSPGGGGSSCREGRSNSRLSQNSSRGVSSSRSVSSSRWQRRRRRSGSRRSSSSRCSGASGKLRRRRSSSTSNGAGKWWRAYNRRGQQQRQRGGEGGGGGGGAAPPAGKWRGRRTSPVRDSEPRSRSSGDDAGSISPASACSLSRKLKSSCSTGDLHVQGTSNEVTPTQHQLQHRNSGSSLPRMSESYNAENKTEKTNCINGDSVTSSSNCDTVVDSTTIVESGKKVSGGEEVPAAAQQHSEEVTDGAVSAAAGAAQVQSKQTEQVPASTDRDACIEEPAASGIVAAATAPVVERAATPPAVLGSSEGSSPAHHQEMAGPASRDIATSETEEVQTVPMRVNERKEEPSWKSAAGVNATSQGGGEQLDTRKAISSASDHVGARMSEVSAQQQQQQQNQLEQSQQHELGGPMNNEAHGRTGESHTEWSSDVPQQRLLPTFSDTVGGDRVPEQQSGGGSGYAYGVSAAENDAYVRTCAQQDQEQQQRQQWMGGGESIDGLATGGDAENASSCKDGVAATAACGGSGSGLPMPPVLACAGGGAPSSVSSSGAIGHQMQLLHAFYARSDIDGGAAAERVVEEAVVAQAEGGFLAEEAQHPQHQEEGGHDANTSCAPAAPARAPAKEQQGDRQLQCEGMAASSAAGFSTDCLSKRQQEEQHQQSHVSCEEAARVEVECILPPAETAAAPSASLPGVAASSSSKGGVGDDPKERQDVGTIQQPDGKKSSRWDISPSEAVVEQQQHEEEVPVCNNTQKPEETCVAVSQPLAPDAGDIITVTTAEEDRREQEKTEECLTRTKSRDGAETEYGETQGRSTGHRGNGETGSKTAAEAQQQRNSNGEKQVQHSRKSRRSCGSSEKAKSGGSRSRKNSISSEMRSPGVRSRGGGRKGSIQSPRSSSAGASERNNQACYIVTQPNTDEIVDGTLERQSSQQKLLPANEGRADDTVACGRGRRRHKGSSSRSSGTGSSTGESVCLERVKRGRKLVEERLSRRADVAEGKGLPKVGAPTRRFRRGRGFFNCSSPESRRGYSEEDEQQLQYRRPGTSSSSSYSEEGHSSAGETERTKRRYVGRRSRNSSRSSNHCSVSDSAGPGRRLKRGKGGSALGCTAGRKRPGVRGEEEQREGRVKERRFPSTFLYGWSTDSKRVLQGSADRRDHLGGAIIRSQGRSGRASLSRQQLSRDCSEGGSGEKWQPGSRRKVFPGVDGQNDVEGSSGEDAEQETMTLHDSRSRSKPIHGQKQRGGGAGDGSSQASAAPHRESLTSSGSLCITRGSSRQQVRGSRKRRREGGDGNSSSFAAPSRSDASAAAAGAGPVVVGHADSVGRGSYASSRQLGSGRLLSCSPDSSVGGEFSRHGGNNMLPRGGKGLLETAAGSRQKRTLGGTLQHRQQGERSSEGGRADRHRSCGPAEAITSEEEGCIAEQQRRRHRVSVSPLIGRGFRGKAGDGGRPDRSRRREIGGEGRDDVCESEHSSNGEYVSFAARRVRTLHAKGRCLPCRYYWKPQGCRNGSSCKFCHDPSHGEQHLVPGSSPIHGAGGGRRGSYKVITPYSGHSHSSSCSSRNSSANSSRSGSLRRNAGSSSNRADSISSSVRGPRGPGPYSSYMRGRVGNPYSRNAGDPSKSQTPQHQHRPQRVLAESGSDVVGFEGAHQNNRAPEEEPEEGEVLLEVGDEDRREYSALDKNSFFPAVAGDPCPPSLEASVGNGDATAGETRTSAAAVPKTGDVCTTVENASREVIEYAANGEVVHGDGIKKNKMGWGGLPRHSEKDAARAALLSLQQQAMRRMQAATATGGGGHTPAELPAATPVAATGGTPVEYAAPTDIPVNDGDTRPADAAVECASEYPLYSAASPSLCG